MPSPTHVPVVPAGMEQMYDVWHLAPAVRAGDFVLCSGVLGTDADGRAIEDLDAQFDAVFANLGVVLAAAGADLGHVVEMVSFHLDLEADIAAFGAAKDRHLTDSYPAWTAVGVTQLGAGAVPGARVEVKATAYVGEAR